MAAGNVEFFRAAKIILDILPDLLRDFLASNFNPCQAIHLPRNVKLTPPQQNIFGNIQQKGNYSECDISLSYILIRNLYKVPPIKGWGKTLDPADYSLSADAERIRVYRNEVYAHANSCYMSKNYYVKFVNDVRLIIQRFDTCHGG